MNIRIRFFGFYEEYLGSGVQELALPPLTTAGQLIVAIKEHWAEETKEIWDFEKDTFKFPFILMVDGHDIQNMDYLLHEGCLVTLIPPIVGG